MPRTLRILLAATLLAATALSCGEPASPPYEGPFEPLPEGCTGDREPVGIDDTTALGVPRELLAGVVGEWHGELTWLPEGAPPEWSVSVDPGTVPVHLTITAGSAIETVVSRPREGGRLYCPTVLDVLAELHVRTDDGLLDERWEVALRRMEGVPDWSWHRSAVVDVASTVSWSPSVSATLADPEQFVRVTRIEEGVVRGDRMQLTGAVGTKAFLPTSVVDGAEEGGWLAHMVATVEAHR